MCDPQPLPHPGPCPTVPQRRFFQKLMANQQTNHTESRESEDKGFHRDLGYGSVLQSHTRPPGGGVGAEPCQGRSGASQCRKAARPETASMRQPVRTWGRGTRRPICRRCIDATRHCATVSLGKTGPGGVLPTHSGLRVFAPEAVSDTFFSLSCQCYLKCTATHHPLRTEVETSPGSRFCLGRLWGLNLLGRQEPPFYSRGLASSSLERSG